MLSFQIPNLLTLFEWDWDQPKTEDQEISVAFEDKCYSGRSIPLNL